LLQRDRDFDPFEAVFSISPSFIPDVLLPPYRTHRCLRWPAV